MLPLLSLEVNLKMLPLDTAVIINMQTDILILKKKVLVLVQKRSVGTGEEAGLLKDCLILWYTPARKLGNINTVLISSLKYLVQKL